MFVIEGFCDTVVFGENDSVVFFDLLICMFVELIWRKFFRSDLVLDCVVRFVELGNYIFFLRDGFFSDFFEFDGVESFGVFFVDFGLRILYVIVSGMFEEVMYLWDRLFEEKGIVEVEGLEFEELSVFVSSLKLVRKFFFLLTLVEIFLYFVMGIVFKDFVVLDKFICGKIKRVLELLFKEVEVFFILCGGRLVLV